MQIRVIDNFLDPVDFLKIRKDFLGPNIPWYFNFKKISINVKSSSLNDFQFTHILFRDFEKRSTFDYVLPLIKKINPLSLIRVKANLTNITLEPFVYGMHVDIPEDIDPVTTAVFYVNTTNGYTLFENGQKVEGIGNRIVLFPAHMKHSAVSCTDQKIRCVININYITGINSI